MKKDIIITLLIIMLLAAFVLVTDFKSVEEYYLENAESIKAGDKTVFISISCNTIFDNMEKLDPALAPYVPKDGTVLEETEYVLREGDTVFDILLRAVKTHRIQMEYSGAKETKSVYIEGLANIYEFSCGDLSGWTYLVNGERPHIGISSCTLAEGDRIEIVYTCELYADLETGAVK